MFSFLMLIKNCYAGIINNLCDINKKTVPYSETAIFLINDEFTIAHPI